MIPVKQRQQELGTEMVFELVREDRLIALADVVLRYSAHAPLEIKFEIKLPGQSPVEWRICRQLLKVGLMLPSGLADVQIWPGNDNFLLLELRSDTGHAKMRVRADQMKDFLMSTYTVVAPEEEIGWLGLDLLIEQCRRLAR